MFSNVQMLAMLPLKLDSNPEPLSSLMNTQPFGQIGQMLPLFLIHENVPKAYLKSFTFSK